MEKTSPQLFFMISERANAGSLADDEGILPLHLVKRRIAMKIRIAGMLVLFAVALSLGCTSKVGLVALDTRPQGATIYLDDNMVGQTPVQFELNLEIPVTLRIEKDGYYPQTESLNVRWVKSEHYRGNLIKGQQTTEGTSQKTWEVRTARDLIRIE